MGNTASHSCASCKALVKNIIPYCPSCVGVIALDKVNHEKVRKELVDVKVNEAALKRDLDHATSLGMYYRQQLVSKDSKLQALKRKLDKLVTLLHCYIYARSTMSGVQLRK
jgi:hypothetical protein